MKVSANLNKKKGTRASIHFLSSCFMASTPKSLKYKVKKKVWKVRTYYIFIINWCWSQVWAYSGDLNNEHLNKGNIWVTNFHLFAIQMPGKSSLFKPCPEYRTKSSVVTQPISQTPYDLNSQLLICYSSHGLNNEPYDEPTVLDHSNTELVRYFQVTIL